MTDLCPDQDVVRKYLFDRMPEVRVMTVRLKRSCYDMLAHQNMPNVIFKLCGEMAAAVSILAHMLKFDGKMTIQLKGSGALSMLVAECSSDGTLRATGQWSDVLETMNLQELVGVGHLAVTVDPEKGVRYQGVVALDQETLSDCLNSYFENSDQLDTKIWLSADLKTAGGLLLHRIANDGKMQSTQGENWLTADALAHTVTNDELINDAGPLLTYRLFHELKPRGLAPWPIQFGCSCSHERSARAMRALGKKEVETLFKEQADVIITCHFCGQVYQYDQADLEWLLSDQPPGPDTLQ